MYWGLPRSRRNIKRLDTSHRKTRYHALDRGWTFDRTEGATGGRQTSIPPVVVAKRRAGTPRRISPAHSFTAEGTSIAVHYPIWESPVATRTPISTCGV